MHQHTENYKDWIQSILKKNSNQFLSLIQIVSDAEKNSGCDIEMQGEPKSAYKGSTPLMLACEVGFVEGAQKLLEYPGVDFNKKNDRASDMTAFAMAVDSDCKELVDYMFDNLPLSVDDMQFALLYYAKLNDVEKVKISVEKKGVNINFQFRGNTALTEAISNKSDDVVDFLRSQKSIDLNCPDSNLNPPVVIAMLAGNEELVQYLFPRCDMTQQSYCYGSPLSAAILLGFGKLAEEMLDKLSKDDLKNHPLILQCAIFKNDKQIVAKLISMNIDVNEVNDENYEEPFERFWSDYRLLDAPFCQIGSPLKTLFELPLVLSVREDHDEITAMLIAAHADPLLKGVIGCAYDIAADRPRSVQDLLSTRPSHPNV